MTNVAPIVSAVAATIAAILAGAGLVAAARRENTKWAREELVDSLSAFLDASFTCKGIVKDGIRMIDDLSHSEVDDIYQRAHDVELRMREVQTRLRLLATPEIVDAAQEVRVVCKRYCGLLKGDPSDAKVNDEPLRNQLWVARYQFIGASKSALALPRSWRRVPRSLIRKAEEQAVKLG